MKRFSCPSVFVLLSVLCFFQVSGTVYAIGYDDFPPELQSLLDERIADLAVEGGGCVAGRVTFSDGEPIADGQDVLVTAQPGYLLSTTIICDGGWFISQRNFSSAYFTGRESWLFIYALGYEPIETLIYPSDGEICYHEEVMDRTPPEELATLFGVVVDENGDPYVDARIDLAFPFPYAAGRPEIIIETDMNGEYVIEGLTDTEYWILAREIGYTHGPTHLTLPPGEDVQFDIVLTPRKKIDLDYVYQPNGTTSFFGDDIQSGSINGIVSGSLIDFARGGVISYDPEDLPDLLLYESGDLFELMAGYQNGNNGLYGEGVVPFESVTRAFPSRIHGLDWDCLVDHVYVVRTYDEQNYAKCVVKSVGRSCRSIVPYDPPPFEFDNYGITLDFWLVSKRGRVYIEKHEMTPEIPDATSLPYHYYMYVLTSVRFGVDMVFSYDESELAANGMTEENLFIYRSLDDGNTWERLATEQDSEANTLSITRQTRAVRYAIVQVVPNNSPDFDQDGDVDLDDFRQFQNCYSGADVPADAACSNMKIDSDSDIDCDDLSVLLNCLSGPGVEMDPACTL